MDEEGGKMWAWTLEWEEKVLGFSWLMRGGPMV
jgi:hypothetical protein